MMSKTRATKTITENTRRAALYLHLKAQGDIVERTELEDITPEPWDENYFSFAGEDYRVLTEKEADRAARDYILDSVWAFNPEFLAVHCVEGVDAETIQSIQENDRCESNNPVLLRLIEDVNRFVDDAIMSDGRGHFLSFWDGVEHEVRIGTEWFYVYRN